MRRLFARFVYRDCFFDFVAMKKPFLYALLLCTVVFIGALLFIFRIKPIFASPSGRIWTGYRVLAVPADVESRAVLETLASYGIRRVIAEDANELLAVNPLVPIDSVWSEYKRDKTAFFFDESGAYRLYYLEDEANVTKKIALLKKETRIGIGVRGDLNKRTRTATVTATVTDSSRGAGSDLPNTSGWKFESALFTGYASLAAVLVFFAVFFVKSKRKFLYTSLCAPFLYLCALMPLFSTVTVAASACTLSFIIQHFWQKPRWVRFVLTDSFTLIVGAFFVASSFFDGAQTAGFVLGALVCSACLFFVFSIKEKSYGGMHVSFINAVQVSAFTLKTKFRIGSALLVCALITKLFFVYVERNFTIGGLNGLSIPVPTEYTTEETFSLNAYESLVTSESSKRVLPDLGEYVSLCWKTDVFPYVSLYSPFPAPLPGVSVQMPTYKTEGEKTVSAQKIMYTFDERYLQTVLQKVEHSPFASTERLLYAQNRFVTVSYKKF